ncbi:hypothetical protein GYMLUDRAFT_952417 [Collybiopsis luxurians FD-317 M1]|nr:hypothetical protein GYMLUDRAFT_952417 [Collybiopsis luxurians FD-317 M1]
MASTLKDPPFTGTFHSDILLLSSLLHGQQDAHCKARPRDTKNAALSLVTHIATLLTTSNPRDPSISYDHAVTGHVEQLLIQCFVFIKNFQSKLTSQNDSRGPETHQLVPLAVDIENGRNLLLSWDSRTS